MYRHIEGFFTALGIVAFCFVVWFTVVAMWKAPIHQFNLWRLGRNFQHITLSHPPESKLLLSIKDFGNLFRGASNGCDYFVGEFRSAGDSKEKTRQNYGGLFVDSFDSAERIPVEVYFLDEEEFSYYFQWYGWQKKASKLLETLEASDARDDIYFVFVAQTDYPPDGDIRCL